ncbi:MAG: SDR family oxidoreductase [Deltaproteobacteria bacterium]|nr:SDR family oxidoreductase [Deltaproteobacteria bacterium]
MSVTSDIGTALAKRYSGEGHRIIGTYRTEKNLEQLKDIPGCHLYHCDVGNRESIDQLISEYKKLNLAWDVFISCPCTPLPHVPFFKCNFDEWSESIHINAIEQLRVLHQLFPMKKTKGICDVVFFAGGGTNNAVVNFSAYTVSKIMLIKMCEFLDAENEDLNIFIVGPGWTKTKTHFITLEHMDKTDKKYPQLVEFMKSGVGTSMDDIYHCIEWLREQGKEVASGRNFSIVNDQWKEASRDQLAMALKSDINMYKLRRHGNNFLVRSSSR